MKIGVMSDSHGDIYGVKFAVKKMGNVDMIIHLGDYCRDAENVSKEIGRQIITVKGNCDFSSRIECDRIIEVDGLRFLITHGHNYNVKSSYTGLYFKALEEKADVVLFGHTHCPHVSEADNIIFINPGSLSKPRWPSETYALITIEDGSVVPNIVELY